MLVIWNIDMHISGCVNIVVDYGVVIVGSVWYTVVT